MKQQKKKNVKLKSYKYNLFNHDGVINKPLIITLIVVVALALLISLIWLIPSGGVSTGQAYHFDAEAETTSISENMGVRIGYSNYFADDDDLIWLDIYVRTGIRPINQIDFQLSYDNTKIEVDPVGCVADGSESGQCDFATPIPGFGTRTEPSGTDPWWAIFSTSPISTPTDGELLLMRIPFRVTGANQGESLAISIDHVQLRDSVLKESDGATPKVYPGDGNYYSASTNVLIVPTCIDGDEDGYGAEGTDLRACPQYGDESGTINGDCNDFESNVNPGKSESCNNVDDNCANGIDEGLTHNENSNLNGVCAGHKVCGEYDDGSGPRYDMWDSYLIDPSLALGQEVYYTSYLLPEELPQNQFNLYEAEETLCDFFDNDCDGEINEGLTGCSVGSSSLVGMPPGNVFLDYDYTTNIANDQKLDAYDQRMLSRMRAMMGDIDCGSSGQSPCEATWGTDNLIYLCKEGTYWINWINYDEITKYNPDGSDAIIEPVGICP
jgi:hypothetical protein